MFGPIEFDELESMYDVEDNYDDWVVVSRRLRSINKFIASLYDNDYTQFRKHQKRAMVVSISGKSEKINQRYYMQRRKIKFVEKYERVSRKHGRR